MSRNLLLGLLLSAVLHSAVVGGWLVRQTPAMQLNLGEQSEVHSLSLAMLAPAAPPPKPEPAPKPKPRPAKPKYPQFEPIAKPSLMSKSVEPEPIEEQERLKEADTDSLEKEVTAEESVDDSETTQEPSSVAEYVQSSVSQLPPMIDQPVFYYQQAPSYPRRALRRQQKGTVWLMLLVNEQGRVLEVELAESSGHGVLDRAAIKAVKLWRIKPAEQGGIAVVSRVKVPIKFDLRSS